MKKIYFTCIFAFLIAFFQPVFAGSKSSFSKMLPSHVFVDEGLSDLKPFIKKNSNLHENQYHLFSHGKPGQLLIEGEWKNAVQISKWLLQKENFENIKQLNIYGCEFGKGEVGKLAIDYLRKKLKISIAASNNLTGKNGDWILEAGHFTSVKGLEDFDGTLQCPIVSTSNPDTDGDGIPDSIDTDDDNDGISDVLEGLIQSPNAITNGNFGTNNTSGGNLNGWTTNGSGTTTTSNNWLALSGGAVAYLDGAEGLNLSQSGVVFKTSSTPKTATFSVAMVPINAASVATAEGWGKISFWMTNASGTLVKLFTVYNPLTANLNSPSSNIVEINSTLILGIAVNGNFSSQSITNGVSSTLTVLLSTDALATSGTVLIQRNNGTGSGPNGSIGGDDFIIDDASYSYDTGPDTDGDGIADYKDLDSDNDGIPDAIEACGNTNITLNNCRIPYNAANDLDADGNGCPDGKVNQSCTAPKDTDNDGIADFRDLDSDNDGCSDANEAATTGFTVNTVAYLAPYATSNGLTSAGCFKPTNTNWLNSSYAIACYPDTDGDGITDNIDIDDDNDGVLDAVEAPACYYTAAEAMVIAKVTTGLASSTVNGAAVTPGNNIPTMYDGTSTSVAAGNHIIAAAQTTTTNAVIYNLEYPVPVNLASVSVTGATASWGTGSFAVLEGSSNGISYTALSAPLATSTGATKTWNVTLNTGAFYRYYRIRVSTVGSTTPTFTNYEVTAIAGTAMSSSYIASSNPKSTCNTDTDGDGITNNRDLDSDGDGCSDAREAGATTTTTPNFQFPNNNVNALGLPVPVQGATTSTVNYTSNYNYYAVNSTLNLCKDTDGDGIPDLIDIDDVTMEY